MSTSPSRPGGGSPGLWRSALLYARGLVVDQRQRRWLMFYCIVGAMFFVFVGDSLIDKWLMAHLLRFTLWWLTCALLTLFSILLVIYDILSLRVQERAERRRLHKEMLPREHPED